MATSGAFPSRHSSDNLQSYRASRPVVSSPWNQVVRGESDPVAAAALPLPPSPSTVVESSSLAAAASPPGDDSSSVSESSDNGCGHNGNTGKRPAWNKPSNGAAASESRTVMGANTWPALSKSTGVTMKSSSESSKGLMDGSSLPQLQGQVSDNASANNMVPIHQKPIKQNNSNSSSNGGHSQLSAPQGSMAMTVTHNSFPKDHQQRSGFVSNDHLQLRNSFRNRNGGPYQRGDSTYHNNYGSRRDQDCGNQDWNTHRNLNGRDTHMPPRVVPRFTRPPPPPPNSAHFIPPPPLRPFPGSIGFPELGPHYVYYAAPAPPLDSLRGVPFVPPIPPPALFFPAPDPQLHTKIVNQIDYYFSCENLIKDIYLRQKMDDQGWVPIKLIAGFNKVKQLTDNIQIIFDAVRTSSVVEVQGDKIRRRNDWGRWTMPPVQCSNAIASQHHGKLSHDKLAEQVQRIALETTDNDGAGGLDVLPDSSLNRPYGDMNSPLLLSTSEGTGQVGIQVSDHSISARN